MYGLNQDMMCNRSLKNSKYGRSHQGRRIFRRTTTRETKTEKGAGSRQSAGSIPMVEEPPYFSRRAKTFAHRKDMATRKQYCATGITYPGISVLCGAAQIGKGKESDRPVVAWHTDGAAIFFTGVRQQPVLEHWIISASRSPQAEGVTQPGRSRVFSLDLCLQ